MSPIIYHDLKTEVKIQEKSTVSKTIYNDDNLKVVLFGFASGQELSEHTAAVPAVIHILSGEAEIVVGDSITSAIANTFIYLPAKAPHSILAKSPTRMLLSLIKGAK